MPTNKTEPSSMAPQQRRPQVGNRALRLPLLYLACGLLWVLGTDQLFSIFGDQWFVTISILKGSAFVAVTAALLYLALRGRDETKRFALNRHYEYIVRYANDILILLDDQYNIVEANDRTSAAYGYTRAELIGMSMYQFRAAEARAGLAADLGGAGPDGRVYETFHQRKDGTTFPVEISARPMDINGQHFFQGIIRDLTARKQAEAVLRDSRDSFRRLLDSMAEGAYGVDTNGNCTFVNQAFLAMLGYQNENEVLGKHMHALIHHSHADGRPYPSSECRMYCAFRTRQTINVSDEVFWHKDGIAIPVEYWAHPIVTAGVVTGAIATFFDITERRQMEEVVTVSRQRLRALLDSIPDAAWMKDEQGYFLAVNQAYSLATGKPVQEMIGKTNFELWPAELAENYRRADENVISSKATVRQDEYLPTISGSRWFETINSPIFNDVGDVVGTTGIAHDITKRKQAERAMQRINRALKVLSACNMMLVHANDEQGLLAEICRLVVDVGGYRMAWVGFARQDTQKTVHVIAQYGFDEGYLEQGDITWADTERGRGPMGTAIRTGVTDIVQDCAVDTRMAPWREAARQHGYRSVMALPLTAQGRVIGALGIYADADHAFDPEEIHLLEELAADLAFGIVTLQLRVEHSQAAERLERSMASTIEAMAATVEKRDPYTAGHQGRVAELAVAIGREIGLPQTQLDGIKLGAMIHDIGKIYIPAEILNRPGRLGEHEIGMIRTHPQVGFDIVKNIDFIWPIKEMIVQHHERVDGSGYPAGLKGDQIRLEARILAVADVVEAMASHRPYRPALGVERGLEEVQLWSGKHYDPEVVDACLRLFKEKRFNFDFDQNR